MTDIDKLVRVGGTVLVLAGILYIAVPFVPETQGLDRIGTTNWLVESYLGTLHHFLLPFGLFALFAVQRVEPPEVVEGGRDDLFAVQREPAGLPGLVAFVVATLGNALAAAVDVVWLTVLPVMAASPEGQAALICLPFYEPATEAARGFIAAACEGWNFSVLGIWNGAAWFILLLGSITLGLVIMRAQVLRPWPGLLLVIGWLGMLAGVVAPVPEAVAGAAYAVVGAAYAWCGVEVWRRARAE